MKTNRILATLLLAAAAVLSPFAAYADGAKHRVVLQVSDDDAKKWNLVLNVAENVQQAYGKDKVDIEIVAYGPGLKMLKSESKVAARLNKAQDSSISLYACANTMRKMKLTKGDLHPGMFIAADGGVVHILQRQGEGWQAHRP